MDTNINENTWYDLYDKEHIMPDDKPLLLLLENDIVVRDDSNWDEEYPFNMVLKWKLAPEQ